MCHECVSKKNIYICVDIVVFCVYLCVAEQGTGLDRFILAQLTQLYMTVKLECPFYEVRNLNTGQRVEYVKDEAVRNLNTHSLT